MVVFAVESAAAVSAQGLGSYSKLANERRRRPLTVAFGVCVGLLLFTLSSKWPRSGITDELFYLAGITLACIGTLGRIWSNVFVSGYKSRTLITTGPYSVCRNPLYFFSAIGMTGVGLATNTLLVPALLIVCFALYYPLIIRSEERRLAFRHGEEFEEYCQRTPAFFPRLSSYEEPATHTMYPRAMRKNLADAFWFIILTSIVHLEATSGSLQFLPQLFRVW